MTPPLATAYRLALLLLAGLQLVLPGAAMVAEGHLVAETERVAHVEAYAADCGALGHPAECAICQFLRSPARGAEGCATPPAAEEWRSGDAGPDRDPLHAFASPSPLPRSPPSRA